MNLTVKTEWLESGYTPRDLYESPFREKTAEPRFWQVAAAPAGETTESLQAFSGRLLTAVEAQLAVIPGPVHCLLSGGYDSRILATILERLGKAPLYVTDGTEEPECSLTLDHLGVPKKRRYLYDLDRPDPYGLVEAYCDGFAPLYSQMRFSPARKDATLVTGLGGGEWFSYPAGGWHNGKQHRTDHVSIVDKWLDCWPQYTLLPEAWARGYKTAVHPYCTLDYARVANQCRPEWLVEPGDLPALDLVRKAMLDTLDPELAGLGWVPHDYDWRLTDQECERIDTRFAGSWLARTFGLEGEPSLMDRADHACTLAGFASWCDQLIADGATLS